MSGWDPGPPSRFAEIFERVPNPPDPTVFWGDWGPVFYRGRLDGTARLLCIASDPGATERIAGRTLVGDAGQRLQGFFTKLGLTRSYLCLNAFAYGLFPSTANAENLLKREDQLTWRNELYDAAVSERLEAIAAFGVNAQAAVRIWDSKPDVPVVSLRHPTSHDEGELLTSWIAGLETLRKVVTPDPDGDATGPGYEAAFTEEDYAPIPRDDLPFGAPWFLGDDRWARTRTPPLQATVKRPKPDDRHTLIWTAPQGGQA